VTRKNQPSTTLVIRSLDTRMEKTVAPEEVGPSFWLRDGWLASPKRNAINRDSLDGRSEVLMNLQLAAHDVALAPDGKTVYALVIQRNGVFVSSTVAVLDVATSQFKRAFALPTGSAAPTDIRDLGNYLSLSPDGAQLAIVRWNGERQPHIERWGVDGKPSGE